MTRVVSLALDLPYDVYCGRGRDPRTGIEPGLGNLWSHIPGSTAKYRTKTKLGAVKAHREYALNTPQLILNIREKLKDKTLACHCSQYDIDAGMCHAVTLARVADGTLKGIYEQ